MKTVKVKFVDFWAGFKVESSLFYQILSKYYNVELCDDPDYLFFSVFGEEHFKYSQCIKIFYTGENTPPDFNLCDYAISFEYMDYLDRHFRLPLYYMYQYSDILSLCESKHMQVEQALTEKSEFCSFVVSNSTGVDVTRERLFEALCGYKKVNSGGRHLNNIGMPDGVPDKLAFQKKHKFALACENSSHPGYVTEKLVEAFAAQTVPIYWGDPFVKRDFNEKAFICVDDFPDTESLIERIREIDQNDELWLEMLRQPALKCDAVGSVNLISDFEEWLYHIFDQDKQAAYRHTEYGWAYRYLDKLKESYRLYNIFFALDCYRIRRMVFGVSQFFIRVLCRLWCWLK